MSGKMIVIVAGGFAVIYFALADELFRSGFKQLRRCDEIALFCCAFFCSLWCFAAFASKKKKKKTTSDPRLARLIESENTDDLNTLQAIAVMAMILKPDAAETQEIFEAVMTRGRRR